MQCAPEPPAAKCAVSAEGRAQGQLPLRPLIWTQGPHEAALALVAGLRASVSPARPLESQKPCFLQTHTRPAGRASGWNWNLTPMAQVPVSMAAGNLLPSRPPPSRTDFRLEAGGRPPVEEAAFGAPAMVRGGGGWGCRGAPPSSGVYPDCGPLSLHYRPSFSPRTKLMVRGFVL